ncbi:MAG: hypothetical protein R3A51_16245 [Nannocystaceae bacterium]|nr:hypothetical protein [Myxococcales bacterium]
MSEATQRARAERAYDAIERCANNNSIVQGLSGLAGFPFTLGTDVAVVPLYYVPLWNEIRDIYERTPVREEVVAPFLTELLPDLLTDLALDKILGSVPLAGIYFNAICAKAMTWRLGTLFAFMSSCGQRLPEDHARPALALIRGLFPQEQMFKFQTPDRARFLRFVTGIGGVDPDEARRRIDRALAELERDP